MLFTRSDGRRIMLYNDKPSHYGFEARYSLISRKTGTPRSSDVCRLYAFDWLRAMCGKVDQIADITRALDILQLAETEHNTKFTKILR